MTKIHKRWSFLADHSDLAEKLGTQLRVSKIVAEVLINRGLTNLREAKAFLYGGEECLEDPFLLRDVEKAAKRIILALNKQEKITVYGDYDADGITSTALLYRVLDDLGARVDYYIPDRQSEGYGLNGGALEELHCSGTTLLLTVDCGISAVDEVALLAGKMDIIITDHHRPPEILPAAYAIVNPQQKKCDYTNKDLAGVGVAYKLCQVLCQMLNQAAGALLQYLDLVAIGTVADIVPLLGENRVLVKMGLRLLPLTKNIGLQALLKVCGLDKNIDAGKVGFVIGPRLNAVGRVGRADAGVELLLTEDQSEAAKLAAKLEEENTQRQALELSILAEAEKLLARMNVEKAKVIVLAGENWHPGVIGIVASRIVDKYYRPTVIISEKDGIGKGSCRSIPGFDLYSALQSCEGILLRFGGHCMAAGLTILSSNIDELRKRLNNIAERVLTEQDYIPELQIDSTVMLDKMDTAFLEQLTCLEPYGMGNSRPVFACQGIILTDVYKMGQSKQHLKGKVIQGNHSKSIVGWGMGFLAEELQLNQSVDIAFNPGFNDWQGQRSVQLRVHDIRHSVAVKPAKCDSRRDSARLVIGQVYLVLKHSPGSSQGITATNKEIMQEIRLRYKTVLSERGIDISLTVLQELGLVRQYETGGSRIITLLAPPAEKLDITCSATFSEGMLQYEIS
ncbi:MAG: single-stranded-DNA-specific exonuclease RecJ [Veillonellales bacterium]